MTASTDPTIPTVPIPASVRVAALGDIHFGRIPLIPLAPLFAEIEQRADILCICGDLTDTGLPEHARALVKDLSELKLPKVAVLGNHDHEAGRADELKLIFNDAGVRVLDGDAFEANGIGFAGVKGFAGGVGRRTLGPWGERAVKDFVQEAINEAQKLVLVRKLRAMFDDVAC